MGCVESIAIGGGEHSSARRTAYPIHRRGHPPLPSSPGTPRSQTFKGPHRIPTSEDGDSSYLERSLTPRDKSVRGRRLRKSPPPMFARALTDAGLMITHESHHQITGANVQQDPFASSGFAPTLDKSGRYTPLTTSHQLSRDTPLHRSILSIANATAIEDVKKDAFTNPLAPPSRPPRNISWSSGEDASSSSNARQTLEGAVVIISPTTGGARQSPSSGTPPGPSPARMTPVTNATSSKPPLAPTPTQQQQTNRNQTPIGLFIPPPSDLLNTSAIGAHQQQQRSTNDGALLAAMATSFNSVGAPPTTGHSAHVNNQSSAVAMGSSVNHSSYREVGGIPLVPGLPRSVLQSTGQSANPSPLQHGRTLTPLGASRASSHTASSKKDKYERVRGWIDVIDVETHHLPPPTVKEPSPRHGRSPAPDTRERERGGGGLTSPHSFRL